MSPDLSRAVEVAAQALRSALYDAGGPLAPSESAAVAVEALIESGELVTREEHERLLGSLRLERDGLEFVRRKNNEYLLRERDRFYVLAEELAEALEGGYDLGTPELLVLRRYREAVDRRDDA